MRNDLNKANSNAKAWLTKFSQHQTGSDFQRLRVVMGTQIRKHGEKTRPFYYANLTRPQKMVPKPQLDMNFCYKSMKTQERPDFFFTQTQHKPEPIASGK